MFDKNIIKAMLNANTVMIVSHINPDGDTLGSALSLYQALTTLGKEVDVFCDSDNFSYKLNYIPNRNLYNKNEPKDRYDLAIAVDCAELTRLKKYAYNFNRAKESIDIDHHTSCKDGFAKYNYVEPSAAATCEIMYEVIDELDKVKPCFDDIVAKCLYCGIITDSGNFTNTNTTKRTIDVANKIKERFPSLDTNYIAYYFMESTTKEIFNLKNRVLSKAKFYENDSIAIITFFQEDFKTTNTGYPDTEGIVSELRKIDSVNIAIAITQYSEFRYKVSMRSKEGYRVDRIANVYNGGGHPCAAGCEIDGSYYDVVEKILKTCKDYAE